MDSVTLSIDGKQITVPTGTTVLQAAIQSGVQVPYYCYHPGLGIDGSCRVCIVKIEKMPKLQTSCSTPCADGMTVITNTPDVEAARASVFEFLLINHPLDCPVCDKGGECPLQDFSYTYGPGRSRMEFPRRVFDGEGVRADVDFGPTLMLNRNRCILCTRCVRFMREIDTDAQISIINRGYGSEIATFKEEGVHSLLSGNLMDVCPVGAITTRDYRFKSRPWDNPMAVDTICTQCERGCNTTLWIKAKPEWAKGAQVIRATPRYNPDVNDYWMCDIGRFELDWIEGEQRLRRPLIKRGDIAEPANWDTAMAAVGAKIEEAGGAQAVRFLASAHASLEELHLLSSLGGGARNVALSWRYQPKAQPADTKFVVPPVDAPNLRGARDLGFAVPAESGPADLTAFRAQIESGAVRALFVFDPGPDGSMGDVSWILDARRSGRLPVLIYQGVLLTALAAEADIVLPGACFAEKDATYTNWQGRVQATAQAITPPGEAQEDWRIFSKLGALLGTPPAFTESRGIREAIAAGLTTVPGYDKLGVMVFSRPISQRSWLQTSNPSERWKWDFMFQDLPPVKFGVEYGPMPRADVIPLREVK
ncbi:MAG: molybdopterin-dependent oxidoreductase [Acidobacteriota bacterium]|nr:molybdopterin-dependent oxidoreductase [Acidobacteriota bacterium]